MDPDTGRTPPIESAHRRALAAASAAVARKQSENWSVLCLVYRDGRMEDHPLRAAFSLSMPSSCIALRS